jgi:hypothetical protein
MFRNSPAACVAHYHHRQLRPGRHGPPGIGRCRRCLGGLRRAGGHGDRDARRPPRDRLDRRLQAHGQRHLRRHPHVGRRAVRGFQPSLGGRQSVLGQVERRLALLQRRFLSRSDRVRSLVSGAPGSVDLSVAGIPEPATWALLGIGFLGLGGFGLRRRAASRARDVAALDSVMS